jgi:tripartite-type tricarboxylate transporter receptor subunit TctC
MPVLTRSRVSVLGAMLCFSLTAGAQEFPSRIVNMVVPFTPGTGADIIARTLGPKLAERWKVGVVTDNRSGASGNIAAEHVARATPDGHTLLFTATIFTSNRAVNTKLPFDPVTHFTPVVLIATSPVGLFVHPQFSANTLRDLVTEVKKQPAKFHYASTGNGSPQHLAMELFKLEAGISCTSPTRTMAPRSPISWAVMCKRW